MKKSFLFLMILLVFTLAGCSNKGKMTDFIPTQAPSEDTGSAKSNKTEDAVPAESSAVQSENDVTLAPTPTPRPVVVGKTTTMYVKLDKYGGMLNIRATPSTDGEPVGFLVHAEKIEVIDVADGWASFVYNGVVCYVNADFLVKERPQYLNPPTISPAPPAASTPRSQGVKPEI